ncbi:MAG: DTW domain-containing protein [DPANN group archaeon]|nr:DTW domain-containing protein [DPANN group archaeon]
MEIFILKDYKESEKKCSIISLKGKPGIDFLDRLKFDEYDFSGMLLLHPDGEPIIKIKKGEKILLVDSNWRKARKMYTRLEQKFHLKKIRVDGFKSAYPWKAGRPDNGLCSIEVLWVLSLLAGKRDDLLFQNYKWKKEFFEINKIK